MKKLLLGLLLFVPSIAFALSVPWDRPVSGQINPLYVLDQVKGNYFTATSTTQASTFPYASTTAFSVSGNSFFTGLSLFINGFISQSSSTISVLHLGTPLEILSGGTNASSIGSHMLLSFDGTQIVSTSSPTMAVFFATSTTATSTAANGIDISGGCFAVNSTCLQTFIQNAAAYKSAANYATAAVLPGTPTYSNGASGVGATLTEIGFGALVVDGQTVTLGQRILVKNEAAQTTNGVYVVSTVGSVIANYVLTRSTDYNTSNDIYAGTTIPVLAGGTANGDTQWTESTTGTIVIGTSNITFIETSYGTNGTVTSVAATVPTFLSISGSPITTSGTLAISYSGTALPVANGGTNATSLSSHSILTFNGTSVIGSSTPAAANFIATSSSNSVFPNFTSSFSTTTNATTTNLFSTTASSTNLFSALSTIGTLTLGNALTVANGGTGTKTLTGCLTGNGTGAITGSGTCNTSSATVSSIAAGLGLTGGTITTSGTLGLISYIATGTAETAGQLAAWNTTSGTPAKLYSIATSAPSFSGGLTTTGTAGAWVGGSSYAVTLANANANSVLGCIGAACTPTSVATSSLFTGTTGQNAYFSGTGAVVGTSTIFTSTASQVGIGITSPLATLHVKDPAATGEPLYLESGTTFTQIQFKNTNNANGFIAYDTTGMDFYVNSAVTPTLHITGGAPGSVGVATGTPAKTFSVGGNVIIGASTAGGTNGALTYGGVTLTNTVTGTGSMVLSAAPTVTGVLTATDITSSGITTLNGMVSDAGTRSVCTRVLTNVISLFNGACGTSDARVKTNITDLAATQGLDAILQLRPVNFDWVDPRMASLDGPQIGLLAQDVQKLFPQIVNSSGTTTIEFAAATDKSAAVMKEIPNTLSVDYAKLVTPLIAALQQVVLHPMFGTPQKPTGITLYDDVDGSPYCVKEHGGQLINKAGACI